MTWAWPKPWSTASRLRRTSWPRSARPASHAVGGVRLDVDWSGPSPAQVSNPPCSPGAAAEHPAAGPTARPGDSPWRSSRASTCSRIWGCESPPMVPSTARSEPSGRVTSAGASVWGGRRPGASSAGWPGAEAEADAPVVEEDAGRRLDEVGAPPRRVRLDERDAHAVAVDGAARRSSRRPAAAAMLGGRRSGSMPARRAARRPGSSSSPPSAPSCSTASRSMPGDPGRLDQQVGPGRVVGVVGQVEALGHGGRGERQVALRRRGRIVDVVAPHGDRAAARPTRPGAGPGRRG